MLPFRGQDNRRKELKLSSNNKTIMTQAKSNGIDPKMTSAVQTTSTVDKENIILQATSDTDRVTPSERSDSSRTIASISDPRIIKKQQHRLPLLRHASRCNFPPGECPIGHHCPETKLL